MFVTSYGLTKNGTFTKKAIDFENRYEIYRIGILGDTGADILSSVFVLVWKNKIIPFCIQGQKRVKLKTKNFIHSDNENYHIEIPVICTSLYDIGKDLKLLPNNRRYQSLYNESTFGTNKEHGYRFRNIDEFQTVISIIQSALPVYFYDGYETKNLKQGYFNPVACCEFVIHDIAPWNLSPENYRLQDDPIFTNDFLFAQYLNEQVSDISLETIAETKKRKELEHDNAILNKLLAHEDNSHEKELLLKKQEMDQKLEERASGLLKEFNTLFDNLDNLKSFIFKNWKSETKGGLKNAKKNLREKKLKQESIGVFLKLLSKTTNPCALEINRFIDFHNQNIDKKLEMIMRSQIDNRITIKEALEKFQKNLAKKNVFPVEHIVYILLQTEIKNTNQRKLSFNIKLLDEPLFLECLRNSYNQHYNDILDSFDTLKQKIAETMLTRLRGRYTKECKVLQ